MSSRIHRTVAIVVGFCILDEPAVAQPSQLFSCLEPESFCAESPFDTLLIYDEGCEATFVQFVGRLAFPPLLNRGRVTISVLTRAAPWTTFPLYVETRFHTPTHPPGCTTLTAGDIVLVAQGLPQQCGGVWETVGPIDLTQIGIPLGATYHVQLVGFRDSRVGSVYGSTGFACIRVTSEVASPVEALTWQRAKLLYK